MAKDIEGKGGEIPSCPIRNVNSRGSVIVDSESPVTDLSDAVDLGRPSRPESCAGPDLGRHSEVPLTGELTHVSLTFVRGGLKVLGFRGHRVTKVTIHNRSSFLFCRPRRPVRPLT